MSDRYLITGSGGQLGKALAEAYPEATTLSKSQLDIADDEQLEAIDWSNYDVVINAAAYVNADHSETVEGQAITWRANAEGPAKLSKIAIQYGLHLIHFSSEYVFDGTKSNHNEDESFSPLNVYGQTKAAADTIVGEVPKHHILRTTWVVGEGHNFVRTMNNLANLRIDPAVVNDQFGRLTFTSELVRAVGHILEKDIDSGTYNLSNSGQIRSFAEIAALTFELGGHDPERVKPISTEEYKEGKANFAPRPAHSDLDLSKIRKTGFISVDYEDLLPEYVAALPGIN